MPTETSITRLAKIILQKSQPDAQLIDAFTEDIQEGGFSCAVLRIHITYVSTKDKPAIASYFVKGCTSEELLKLESLSFDNEQLRNERIAYRKSIPMLQKYFGAALPMAKCIFNSPKLLVLEDLKASGFRNRDMLYGLSISDAEAAIKELARWHAASINLKNAEMMKFVKLAELAEDVVFPMSQKDFYDTLWRKTIVRMLNTLESMAIDKPNGELLQKLTDKIRAKYRDAPVMDILDKYLRNRNENSFSVLTHGDFWINNIMFDAENNVKIVDFQAVYERSVALDLWTFIVTSIQPRKAKLHFDRLLTTYYKTLGTLTSGKCFSFRHLKQEMDNFLEYSFLVGIWYLPAHTMRLTREDINNYQRDISEGKSYDIFDGKDTTMYNQKLYHHVMMFREFIDFL